MGIVVRRNYAKLLYNVYFLRFSQHHAHVLPRNGDYGEFPEGGLKGGRCQEKQDCDSGCCKGHSGASSLVHEETGGYFSVFLPSTHYGPGP